MSVYSKSLFIQIYKGNKEFQLISLKKKWYCDFVHHKFYFKSVCNNLIAQQHVL